MACLLFHWTKLAQAWLVRYGTWSLYKGLLSGPREWLLPVYCSLINWWSCKMLQITSSSQKLLLRLSSALSYTLVVSNLSFTGWMHHTCYCCGLLLWCLSVSDGSMCSWPSRLYICYNVSDVRVTASEHSPPGTDIATDIGAGADNGETRPHWARHSVGSFARC